MARDLTCSFELPLLSPRLFAVLLLLSPLLLQIGRMSSSGSFSIRVIPSTSLEGTRSEGWETSVSGSSHSGIPSPEDARSQRDLEVLKYYHDIASVISEEALESIRECYSIPEGYPKVEVIHAEASTKQPVGSPIANQATVGRPSKQVKIAVRKHKSHHGEGSSRRAAQEREPKVLAEDSSPTYRRPKSMRDLCVMQVREDDEGYYVLQMAD
ncbi:hypothetical protein B296_00023479 [Ensete ventricosum]|uniref:Uncharacterized protein n=1 Tax=Ensete ventricosum TaxID=4639 RepID=A0A427ATW0_ENSVE|nr:hypothetical protein B296_00023479 [Ensete ventricosum]